MGKIRSVGGVEGRTQHWAVHTGMEIILITIF